MDVLVDFRTITWRFGIRCGAVASGHYWRATETSQKKRNAGDYRYAVFLQQK